MLVRLSFINYLDVYFYMAFKLSNYKLHNY